LASPLAAMSAWTVTPKRAAMVDSESPFCATYVRGVLRGVGVGARGLGVATLTDALAVGTAVGEGVGWAVTLPTGAALGSGVGSESAIVNPNPLVDRAAPAAPTTRSVAPVIARRRRRSGWAARPIGRQPSSGSSTRRVLMNRASGAGRGARRCFARAAECWT